MSSEEAERKGRKPVVFEEPTFQPHLTAKS